MGGARMARRMYCEYRRGGSHGPQSPSRSDAASRRSLLVGPSDRVEMVLRLLESSPDAEFKPVGILDDSGSYVRMKLRGVPILGATDALELVVNEMEAKGARPDCLILTEAADRLRGSGMLRLVKQAEKLGLKVACLPGLADFEHGRAGELDLRFIDMAELLGRPPTKIGRAHV